MRLTFVCTGNICRSPMAEALFRNRAAARGLGDVDVGSAGLYAVAGNEAVPVARAVAQSRGLDVSRHRARPLRLAALGEDDLLVVMEDIHRRQILGGSRVQPAQVLLLRKFDPGGGEEIDDPYGGPDIAYEYCIARLEVCVDALVSWLEAERRKKA